MRQVVLQVLFLLLVWRKTEGTENEVALEFNALCRILNIAQVSDQITDDDTATAVSANVDLMLTLNMSVSPDSFYDLNFQRAIVEGKESEEYTTYHDKWKSIKENIIKGAKGDLSEVIKRAPKNPFRHLASQAINASLQTAQQLQKSIKTSPTATEIQAELKGVIFGKDGSDPATGAITFSDTNTNAYGGTGTPGTTPGISLASDMVCLCGSNSGTDGTEACAGHGASGGSQHAGSSTATSVFTTLMAHCPKTVQKRPTAAAISSAIANFMTLMGKSTSDSNMKNFVYGKFANNGGCNGANSPTCINYKTRLTTAKHTIPWLLKLESCRDKLSHLEGKKTTNGLILTEVRALTAATRAIYIKALAGGTLTLSPQGAEHPAKTTTAVNPNTDCTKKQKKVECKEDGCKWNSDKEETGEHCKAKDVERQTNAAAGTRNGSTGTETTTEKCKGKLEPECTKAPECQWEGKE
uniref:Variant surface glycoprotein 1166 n=1 Tax=Trypanosoma brucei TaxID=5691 RepID=M4TAY2_9TRYP|nr:variant surface glycoprotein 1166 [Trypanosoma brucei]